MFAGKKLTDFTIMLSSMLFKMNVIDKTSLTDQTKFRLNEITKIENYLNSEINKKSHSVKN